MKRFLAFCLLIVLIQPLSACAVTSEANNKGIPVVAITATELGDYLVMSRDGKVFGEATAVVVEVKKGQVTYLVLSVDNSLSGKGAFLGPRVKLIPIPWDHVSPLPQNNQFILDVDQKTLERAPNFDRWPNTLTVEWDKEIRQYWNIK